jgi:hypothetical protein
MLFIHLMGKECLFMGKYQNKILNEK